MNLARRVLGAHAVDVLTAATTEHVLTIGKDKLTRGELAAVDCYNFIAARRLTAALQSLGVKSLQDVFDHVPPRDLALPHIGTISLAVLGAAFEAKGIGGESPLENYVRQHQPKLTTFESVKVRIRKEEQAAVSTKRRRRRRSAAA